MSTYIKFIAGDQSLDQITQAIRYQEATSSQFKDAVIAKPAGSTVDATQVTYDILTGGAIPKTPTVIAAGATGPTGAQKGWSGKMQVSGAASAVELWRLT